MTASHSISTDDSSWGEPTRKPAADRRDQGGIEENVHGDADRRSSGRQVVAAPHGSSVRSLPPPHSPNETSCEPTLIGSGCKCGMSNFSFRNGAFSSTPRAWG